MAGNSDNGRNWWNWWGLEVRAERGFNKVLARWDAGTTKFIVGDSKVYYVRRSLDERPNDALHRYKV